MVLIEGHVGTGKTATVAKMISILMIMGIKVIVTSQSNKGVDAVFAERDLLVRNDPRLQFLGEKMLRLKTPAKEKDFAEQLQAEGMTHQSGDYRMATRLESYARAHEDSALVKDYRAYVRARSLRVTPYGTKASWENVA